MVTITVPVEVMAGSLRVICGGGAQRDRRGFRRGGGKMWKDRREQDCSRVPQGALAAFASSKTFCTADLLNPTSAAILRTLTPSALN